MINKLFDINLLDFTLSMNNSNNKTNYKYQKYFIEVL